MESIEQARENLIPTRRRFCIVIYVVALSALAPATAAEQPHAKVIRRATYASLRCRPLCPGSPRKS